MTQKQLKTIEQWLDDRFQVALATDARMGNKNDYFLLNNPDYIYYKGACDILSAMGYDMQRTDGKHKLFK